MSDNIIARDFSMLRDFRSIAWGGTLKHNLLRAFCAGIVWAVIAFVVSANQSTASGSHPPMDTKVLLLLPLIVPMFYLIILLPLGLLAGKLAGTVPFAGLFALFLSLIVVVGDPLVCILAAIAPQLVPMHKPGFLMFNIIIFLLKGEDVAADVAVADQRRINKL